MSGQDKALLTLTRARTELLLGHPFFGSMALRLRFVADETCDDIWTDGVSLGFNPRAIQGREDCEVAVMLAHAILHLACEHHLRRGLREPGLWNRACDLAINGLLAQAGFTLPKGFPVDKAHTGRPAEAVYAALLKQMDEKGDGLGGNDASNPVDQPGRAGEGGTGVTPVRESRGSREASAPERESGGEMTRGPQAAGKSGREGRPGDKDSRFEGEVRDHPGLSGDPQGAKRKDLTASARQDVSQSLRASPDMGDLPAGLRRLLGELAAPSLPWAELLRRFVLERAVNDYSWSPPSRRHAHAGLCLPSPRSMTLGDVVLAVDTSGSVDQELLRAFLSELEAVLDACDTRLFLYFCDASAGAPLVLTRQDRLAPQAPVGGGGTDYRPVFARVEDDGARPACLIYLTDLECDRYPDPPAYPVLWAAPERAANTPPFGEVISLR